MFSSLGIKSEQIYGDVYHSWLRDTFEKNTPDSKVFFRDMVESGFQDRQIVLRRQRLGANVMNSLSTMLHRAPLTKLDLNGNALRDTGCAVLAHLLRDLPNLTYLDLGANDIGAQGAQALGFVVAQHKKLAVLILSSRRDDPYANHITPGGATILLEGCLRSRSLRQLDLGGNPIAVELPAAGVDHDEALAAAAADAQNELVGTKASMSGEADGLPAVTPGALTARRPIDLLEQMLERSTCALTTLKLSNVDLTPAGALRLVAGLQSNTTLALLDLSNNGLTAAVGDALGHLLLDRFSMRNAVALTTLILTGNPLFGAQDDPRRNSFQGNSTIAKRLYSARQAAAAQEEAEERSPLLTGHPGSMENHVLLAALTNDRVLQTLEVNRCGVDSRAVRVLCRSLMSNTALRTLGLRHNAIDADAAVSLGRALCRHPCMRRLYLSHNAIEDEGACALATVVADNESIEVLDLQSTRLGDRGLIALGVALQSNQTLRVLSLSDNHFTDAGGDTFAALLEKNESVLRCQLGATSVPYRTVLRLERTTKRNNITLEQAEPDSLKRELVRLHFQKYKLEEARTELENLRDKNAEVKRSSDNFELQVKQDQSDLAKRTRELEEQTENYNAQEEKYRQQRAQLEADLKKAQSQFVEDMEIAKDRLDAEIRVRETLDEEYKLVEAELEDWKNNAAEREAKKRSKLAETYEDTDQWASQRKQYREQMQELQGEVRAMEAQADAKQSKKTKRKGSAKKGKK